MSIRKSRSIALTCLVFALGSGVACSESADPGVTGGAPGAGGDIGAGGLASGGLPGAGGDAAGGAPAGGAPGAGGDSAGGAFASGGESAAGGAGVGGDASGGTDGGGGTAAGGTDGSGGMDGAGGSGPTVPFSEVASIIKAKCGGCHNMPATADKPNLNSDQAIDMAFSSTMAISHCGNNPLVTVNEPDQSALIMLLKGMCTPGSPSDPARMPPMPNQPLTETEIQTISDWIASGAPGPV